METVGKVLLTLLIPVLWGILSAWAFDRLRARRSGSTQREDHTE